MATSIKSDVAVISNPIISRLTKTNVYSYYITYSILALFFLIQSAFLYSFPQMVVGIFVGMLMWTLLEYLMHRIFFHWKARNQIEKMLVFIFHEVHHSYPRDVNRSITPLIFSLPLAVLFYFIFNLVFGKFAPAIFPGFVLGYLVYTIIHDSTHHFPMNNKFIKHFKQHHMRHHYFDSSKNFGVSTTLWDHVFGTYRESNALSSVGTIPS